MKRVLSAVFVCAAVLLQITGCAARLKVGDVSDITVSDGGSIFLSVREGTLSNVGATLILTNGGDDVIEYGDTYEIETKRDAEWHSINARLDFTRLAYPLDPGESCDIELDWETSYGKLPKGTYRIIKEAGDTYVSVEFEIK